MAEPHHLDLREPAPADPVYVGVERRRLGAAANTQHATTARFMLVIATTLAAVIITAVGVRVPRAVTTHGLPAVVAGLALAAGVFYRFRARLLHDVYSAEIGTGIVSCVLALAAATFVDDPAAMAIPLAAVTIGASIVAHRAHLRFVIDSRLQAFWRVAELTGTFVACALLGYGTHRAIAAIWGSRPAQAASVLAGVLSVGIAVRVAHASTRSSRRISVGAATVFVASAVGAVLLASEHAAGGSLALLLLLGFAAITAVETSTFELLAALDEEERRLLDLSALSRAQRELLDAERTAQATQRHDQKATVLAIEGALSVLSEDTTGTLDGTARSELTEAARAELARLRRRFEPHQPLGHEPVALREVLSPLIVCARSEGANVRLDVPAGAVVETDVDCLLEIVQNLIDNAAVHGRNRAIRVSGRGFDDGFEITVADRGPGVPAPLREVVFERGVTSRASDHSGLGLFSSRQFALRLGGTLTIEDNARGGARFVLRVPSGSRA